ncbi:MAG: hypothetical protein HOW73_45890 [Polyangiaceae bacterium]|nr:hypothetical protein [Polyangiaceae bacterium]
MSPDPSEEDYAEAAHVALDKADYRLALTQVGAALSFRPQAPEHRAMLDLILSRIDRPLELLPSSGSAFFGAAAVRAHVLATSGRLNEAILLLLDVVIFRPGAAYLSWLSEWRGSHGLRGVAADAIANGVGRLLAAIDREGVTQGAQTNLEAAVGLLAALRQARPKAAARLALVEAMALGRLERFEEALAVVDVALALEPSAQLLGQKASALVGLGDDAQAARVLEAACRIAPDDAALLVDWADTQLRTGQFASATSAYARGRANERLRAHCDLAMAYIAFLQMPEERQRAERALALSSALDSGVRAVAPLLWLYRTELPPVEDALAAAIMDVIGRVRSKPPPGPVRVRVQLDGPIPQSAQIAFAAALRDVGQTGEIIGEAGDAPLPITARAVAQGSLEVVRALQNEVSNLDDWFALDLADSISVADARALFDLLETTSGEPTKALDRWRLAVLSLLGRGLSSVDDDGFQWICAVATGTDSWAARPALMVLSALARARTEMAAVVRDVFTKASDWCDARQDVRLGSLCLLPGLDDAERGAAYARYLEFVRREGLDAAGAHGVP